MSLLKKLALCMLDKNQLALIWLGQAGFIIKDYQGTKLAIDPYLSNCGERLKNFVRISPALIKPEDLEVDEYFVTHKHFDHFDYDTIPVVAAKNATRFWGPISCVEEYDRCIGGGSMNLLLDDMMSVTENIRVKETFADHGELEPNAIGIWLEIGEFRIYITGDTAYRPEQMTWVKDSKPDIMIASVNGEFGNLTTEEGVSLANYTGAKHMIPCHFWTFVEHKGRPDLLWEAMKKQGIEARLDFLTVGDLYICEKKEDGKSDIFKYIERQPRGVDV